MKLAKYETAVYTLIRLKRSKYETAVSDCRVTAFLAKTDKCVLYRDFLSGALLSQRRCEA